VPYNDRSGRSLQVILTEYTINTILKSIVELDWFSYERNMTSDDISSMIISDFENSFGE
jgi:hypothetical membrane protein